MRACLVSAVALGLVSSVFALPATTDDGCEDHTMTDPQSTAYPQYPDSHVDPMSQPPVYTVYYSTADPQTYYPSVTPQPYYPSADPQPYYPSVTPYPYVTPYPSVVPTEEQPCESTSPEPATTYTDTTPVGGYPSTDYSQYDSFTQSYLKVHNKYRAIHHAPPLVYDKVMADYAYNHVKNGGCHMQHSQPHKYGENLGIGFSNIESCIDAWYNEEKYYNYAHGDFSTQTGHFTQVCWKKAAKIGCGQVQCGHGYYISCNYDTGNVIGQFQANVLAP